MALAVDEVFRVSGIPFSWTSTGSKVDGVPYTGFLELDFEESREGEYVHAQRTDGTPLGITSGLYKIDGFRFKTLIDTGEQICQQLALTPGANGGFGNARWIYILEIFEVGNPTMTVTIDGVKIEKRKLSTAKGSEALAYEFECKALQVTTVGAGLGLTGVPNTLANVLGGVFGALL
jgi:hypothetical protein